MPIVKRVQRVANPRRKTSGRKKMSAKQIRYFGTKRQKAALKASRKRKARRSSRKNPALVLTLGAANPKRRKKSMARRKTRRRNVRRRVVRRRATARRNPVRRRRTARRRNAVANPRRRRVTRRRRRRNPSLFGSPVQGRDMAQAVLGGLIGVTAAKFIPTAIPINLGGGSVVQVILSGLSAFVAGYAAQRFVGRTFGDAVLFGGLMQTGSVALNAFLPSIGGAIGLGDIVNTAGFNVPSNPVLAPVAPVPTQARMGVNGLDRAFGRSW